MSREITISINNWDKYNPRKDLKKMSWIRLQGDIAFSESLFGLEVEAKWLWIFLLSYSSKKQSGEFSIKESYLAHHSGVDESKIEKHLNSFLCNGLISIESISSRVTNESVRICTKPIENVLYERTNERTNVTVPNDLAIVSPPVECDAIRKTTDDEVCHDIAELWNEMAVLNALPKVKTPLSKDRVKKMKIAIREFPTYEDWVRIVNGVVDDDFNLGLNDRKWKANFDWLFHTTKFNYRKIWEAYVGENN